jgi:hypothetical protein
MQKNNAPTREEEIEQSVDISLAILSQHRPLFFGHYEYFIILFTSVALRGHGYVLYNFDMEIIALGMAYRYNRWQVGRGRMERAGEDA